jgi:hypothetical protein
VTVYVGPDKQKYTPHKEILTRVKFFAACLDSGFRESKVNEMSLPEEEPEVFEKLLEYLYHDKIEAEVFDLEDDGDMDYIEREDSTVLMLAKVYAAADRYCMERCQNHIMDYFLVYRENRFATPRIISTLSKRGPRDCLLRTFAMSEIAMNLFDHGNNWEDILNEEERNNIMTLMNAGGIDAQDFLKACIRWVATERDARTPWGPCHWHVHKITKKCLLPKPKTE